MKKQRIHIEESGVLFEVDALVAERPNGTIKVVKVGDAVQCTCSGEVLVYRRRDVSV